jgi:hypothetical protein
MQVRLTKEGQKALGFSPDRIIANVSDDRAFALMQRGFAIQDKGFMALFDGPLPEKQEAKQIEKPKEEIKEEVKEEPKIQPKKEHAVSKKAYRREKAVKK